MDDILNFIKAYSDYAVEFFSFLGNQGHRFFFLYLMASLGVAYGLFRHHQKTHRYSGNFITFLFPKSVWENPAAWLDVRYFFFHGLIGKFLLLSCTSIGLYFGLQLSIGIDSYDALENTTPFGPNTTFIIAVIVMVILALIGDFLAFFIHYLQHKVPLLWQFHKVHHAGEVMHPMSNFREHPIDNLTYDFCINFVIGIVTGCILIALGYIPSNLTIFGFTLFSVLFNLGAYQLRHSHIWLKWPGIWSKLLGSPAHHHIHHSRHPEHLDKNFAFLFPVWDILFGTYVMPEDNRDVEFGIVEDSSELNSCVNLYLIPFRDAYRLLKQADKSKTVKSGNA